jgi:hypothetical protein
MRFKIACIIRTIVAIFWFGYILKKRLSASIVDGDLHQQYLPALLDVRHAGTLESQKQWQKTEAWLFSHVPAIPRWTGNDDKKMFRWLNELDLIAPEITVDPRKISVDDLILVSAWSANHHNEAKQVHTFTVLSEIEASLLKVNIGAEIKYNHVGKIFR